MSLKTCTHLNFSGQAREALDFYHSVFGGEISMVTYDSAGKVESPADAGKIMWGQVLSESGFSIMAYDVQSAKAWNPGENAFYVALRGDDVEEVSSLWIKLTEGGVILQALQPAAWGPLYGMATDRFGVTWVLDVAA